jgi:hypothetical protein
MSAFSRYIGIDHSGAETPEASLKGLRVYCSVGESAANEVPPPLSPRKYWTRRGIAHRFAERLAEDVPTIVGIDWRQWRFLREGDPSQRPHGDRQGCQPIRLPRAWVSDEQRPRQPGNRRGRSLRRVPVYRLSVLPLPLAGSAVFGCGPAT